MQLNWHDYGYYPYERELAVREVATLFGAPALRDVPGGLELTGGNTKKRAAAWRRLTYFARTVSGRRVTETLQSRLESAVRSGKTRQATRYSVHGLHEYKGKFNPQVAKALLNIFAVRHGGRVLDPFCGSGTTLVECAHAGVCGRGVDLNPFAVFLANAKLRALGAPVTDLHAVLRRASSRLAARRRVALAGGPRIACLQSWFTQDTLTTLETIRTVIEDCAGPDAPIFLALASNLLRDYSLQDPMDLRIRRRRTPLPDVPLTVAFLKSAHVFLRRLEKAQAILGTTVPRGGGAEQYDASTIRGNGTRFDAVITSPPYAMALPYIDTQRLSLVWLGLAEPTEVRRLEAALIGSREFRGDERRRNATALLNNADSLPKAQAAFCWYLHESLSERDGFRRRAVPTLLYRYFASMRRCFVAVRGVVRRGAPFALIVGHNHTVLGGLRRDIDTPAHLADLASDVGWLVAEAIPLQTYPRYGYHAGNAVRAETLLILKRP